MRWRNRFAGGWLLRCLQIAVFGNTFAGKNNGLIDRWQRSAFRRSGWLGGAWRLGFAPARFARNAAIEFRFREASPAAPPAAATKAASLTAIAIALVGTAVGAWSRFLVL